MRLYPGFWFRFRLAFVVTAFVLPFVMVAAIGCSILSPRPSHAPDLAPTNVSYKPFQTFETAFLADFSSFENGRPLPEWGANLVVSDKQLSFPALTTTLEEKTVTATQPADFPMNFTFDLRFGYRGCDSKKALSVQFRDSHGKVFSVDFNLHSSTGYSHNTTVVVNGKDEFYAEVPGGRHCGSSDDHSAYNRFKVVKKDAVYTAFLNGERLFTQITDKFANFTELSFSGFLNENPIARIEITAEPDSEPPTVSEKLFDAAYQEYLKAANRLDEIETTCYERYKTELARVESEYKVRLEKAEPALRDQFETEAQYQQRVAAASKAKDDLRKEEMDKKRLLNGTTCQETVVERRACREKMRQLTLASYKVPGTAGVSLRFGQYLAESQIFPVSMEIKNGPFSGIYGGFVQIPVGEARRFHDNESLLAADSLVQISTKSGCPFVSRLEIVATDSNKRYPVDLSEYYSTIEGSIIHKRTGLEWFIGPNRKVGRADGVTWVKNLDVRGGGWRLPSAEELRAIFDPERKAGGTDSSPAHLNPVFSGIGTGHVVWTSKPPVSPLYYQHYFDFEDGSENAVQQHMTGYDYYRVFAVRAPKCR